MSKSLEYLLGGYATNTLTDEEKQQLSEAALMDQALFDALADEEALKSLLADTEARRRILTSLRASAHSKEPSLQTKSRWKWFRQHSSLAWAGSIAAMGLALIFGWQMEKEWGPIVQQEQEAAKSSSRDEVAFRQQEQPAEPVQPIQKEALERKATQVEGIKGGRAVAPEPSLRVDSHKVDRLRQVPAMTKKENDAVEGRSGGRSQALNEQAAPAPTSSSLSKQPQFDPPSTPSAAPEVPESAPSEDRASQGVAPSRLLAKVGKETTLQPSTAEESAQELFYAASGFLADEVMEEKKIRNKADQNLGGALSKAMKPSFREKAFSPPIEQEFAGKEADSIAKGIRYSFVRQTKEGKEEEVDSRKISGNWKDIRLAVESNVSGYLYVLAPLGNGKWQTLVPTDTGQTVKFQDGIKVKSFQRVEFSLAQITNLSGNTIISSLTVLLAEKPLDDLGQWLGRKFDVSKLKIERVEGAVFVVTGEPESVKLIRVDINIAE